MDKAIPTILSLREISKRLNVPLCSVRLLVRRGHVRYQRIGKQYFVPEADVAALIEKGWRREGVRG